MSAHDSSINQYGSNTGAEEIQKVQKEIQKEAQMQKDVEELATIMNLASPQKPHLFSKNRSPTREPHAARKTPHPAGSFPAHVSAPQQTTPANTPANTKQPQKPKEGEAFHGDKSKQPASKPPTVDLTKDAEEGEIDESDEEEIFEGGDCQDILESDVAFIASFKVIITLTHHEHAFVAINDDYTDVGEDALPALLLALLKSELGKVSGVSFKKIPDFPYQIASVDMSDQDGIQELLTFKVDGTWERSKVWSYLDHDHITPLYSFVASVFDTNYPDGFDVAAVSKLLGVESEGVSKEGMWIDVIEVPDDMVFIKDKEAREMYKMWSGLNRVHMTLSNTLGVVHEDGSRIALQKENKNSQPRLNHAKIMIGGEKRILDQRNGDWRFWFDKAGIIEYIKQHGMLPSHISIVKPIQVGGIKFNKTWQLSIRYQPDLIANIQLKDLHSITVDKIKTDAKISTISLDDYHCLFACNRCYHVIHQWMDCPLNPKLLESTRRKKQFNSKQQSTQDYLTQHVAAAKASARKRRNAMQGMTS
jgi:hypothetical protein